MNSMTPAKETARNGALRNDVRSGARLEVGIQSVDFHLFKPRSSRHPLVRGAYELWRGEWQATLCELDGTTHLYSDEFVRLDEIGVLSVNQRCVSLTGLRWLDLSLPMAREDSYFQHWPEDAMQQLGKGVVGISTNTVVHSDWRQALIDPSVERSGPSMPLALAMLSLAMRRFMDSPAEHVAAASRNDRAMNRVAAAIGAVKIGRTILHGIESDLILVTRTNATTRSAVSDVLWSRRYQE